MSKTLRVGLVQQACSDDRAATQAATIAGVRKAASQGAKLVLLQELHATPYFCKVEDPALFDLAEEIPGPSTQVYGELAAELGVVIVTSLFEKRAPGIYHNTAVVMDADGTIAGAYRKMHIPDDPGFYEKFYFTPGDIGFEPIDTAVGRLGVLICWDQWYPEGARLMALAGADLLAFPTAIGWVTSDTKDEQERQRDAWTTIQRSHAIANGLPVLACNRVGQEADPSGTTDGIRFWGSSFVVGPQGEFIARAGEDAEVLVADVDLARSETVRRIWPFLRDRRIDAYEELLLRFRD
ncbi:MAG: carbon-nitrogen hydrolase [Gammaproteobacteria bacterium]